MSTRAVIARPTEKGWLGVYHHSDGYPEGLGRTLWTLYHRRYKGDIPRFHREIIDNNLDGWSALHCFHPGWGYVSIHDSWDGESVIGVDDVMENYAPDNTPEQNYPLPVSYRGDPHRGSPELKRPPFNPRNVKDSWCEWLYIIRPEGLEVRHYSNWSVGKMFGWSAEPLWPAVQKNFSNSDPEEE